jgi:hypothetical protein
VENATCSNGTGKITANINQKGMLLLVIELMEEVGVTQMYFPI